jgi:hypothetical protein
VNRPSRTRRKVRIPAIHGVGFHPRELPDPQFCGSPVNSRPSRSSELASNNSAAWRSGSSGSTVAKRPAIAVLGGRGHGDQPSTGQPTGWPRSLRCGSCSMTPQGQHMRSAASIRSPVEVERAEGIAPGIRYPPIAAHWRRQGGGRSRPDARCCRRPTKMSLVCQIRQSHGRNHGRLPARDPIYLVDTFSAECEQ